MRRILALNHNKKIIHMWINSAMTLKLGIRNTIKIIEYKQLAENSAGCIRQKLPHEERPAPKENYIWRNKTMTTEIIGYMSQQTAQKPTKRPTATRKIKPIHITNAIKSKLLGTLLIVLGALTIPMENDATAFIMCLFLGIAAIIGGESNE